MLACTAAATRPLVARRLVTRASAATAGTEQRTLKALNITRSTLIDSNGGRAVRNVDGDIYEVVYVAENDSVKVLCKSQQLEYATEVGKDNRISIVLESATPMAGGAPSFAQLQSLLKFQGPGPEAINGRLAMVSFLGIAAVEVATGQPILAQVATPAGAAAAAGLAVAVSAASLAPLLLGKVKPGDAFPTPNDSYPNRQLPYFWTALAETINGRVAMVALAALLVEELVRGVPAL